MNLHDPIESISRIRDDQKKALYKLGIKTIEDLLYHFPVRYGDTAEVRSIETIHAGDTAVVFGKLGKLKTGKSFKSKIAMSESSVEDETGTIRLIWFHQPYIAKMFVEDSLVRVEGKITERNGVRAITNPKIESVPKIPIAVGNSLFGSEKENHTLYPVYPESRNITSNWFYHGLQRIFKSGLLDTIIDPIPEDILKKYNLPGIKTAFIWIHSPHRQSDGDAARKRFAFQEIFFIHIRKQQERKKWQEEKAIIIEKYADHMQKFIERFPFNPTESQTHAIETILSDFRTGHPMSRLLEGDVGSGKTAVAAAAAYATVTSRPKGQNFGALQVAYMAPTEILATQHFESFIKYFEYLGISVGLITGSGCRKFPSKVNPKTWTTISRTQLLKWVANGEIPILIGTHSLIQKSVIFKHLAFIVIDEQHRFGTNQRASLARGHERIPKISKKTSLTKAAPRETAILSTSVPHLLSMTATPIPRTLALTIYGDLDLTLLDQMPTGRKPIITEVVLPNKREEVYEHIRKELQNGRQAYVICPRIDEPDPDKESAVNAKSVTEEARRLKKDVFQEYEIEVLHGKMTPAEKDAAMKKFNAGTAHILVATSVVEVGVNVPNATVIIIEGGERFGLAQLHQLRGRVIRGNHQAYCYVFAETKTKKTLDRLHALKTAKNGFELAEYDLAQRGAGELGGGKQWGVSDVGMEAIKNLKMVEAARTEAQRIIAEDSKLLAYPHIAAVVSRKENNIHLE
ncbi:MAG: ATP-dependent DNA helicase RecG [Candidatus Paceibacterota bacterium]|jgi:ATP-dependent DNA helicase RecG